MDIRTKLIFAFVSVSLVSMALLGYFSYRTSSELLKDITTRQLEALAESRQDDLENVYKSWLDQIQLIRSRTRMREHLTSYNETGDTAELAPVQRILDDVLDAVQTLKRITVFSPDGEPLVSTGDAEIPPLFRAAENNEITIGGTHPLTRGDVLVVLDAPIIVDNKIVAVLEVVRDAVDITVVTSDYTGLGETGETFVVIEDQEGVIRVLNPLRHDNSIEPRVIEVAEAGADVRGALAGDEQIFTTGLQDYRGISVWSATRHLAHLNWGLVVKVDEQEELSRILEQRDIIFDLALALSAFAVIGAMILSLIITKPIHELVEVVEHIRDGDMNVRVTVRGDDEIAFLADSINDLMDDIQRQGVVLGQGGEKDD